MLAIIANVVRISVITAALLSRRSAHILKKSGLEQERLRAGYVKSRAPAFVNLILNNNKEHHGQIKVQKMHVLK